ncbi:MAG: TIGR00300 family protein [Planctomycetes bacterium]|nr:TIGR00300 family protein [Planctomycetota bacterium]
MHVHARGHLINTDILRRALDAVTAGGGSYRVVSFEIGRTAEDESRLVLDVEASDVGGLDEILQNLGALGFSPERPVDARLESVRCAGVAPEGFYSTTNLPTRVHVGGAWRSVADQRMDAALVVGVHDARCVKLRDLSVGDRVVVGLDGVGVAPDTRTREVSDFAFMSSDISSERRVEAQAARLAELWREHKRRGERVVVVAGPVVVHAGQAESFAGLVRRGYVDALLAGNALAVHDVEAAMLGTSLGVSQESGRPVLHGHMNHMRAINAVRGAGGLAGAVRAGLLGHGIMHACITSGVPFCLAGSIRDDGPLPDTEMDLLVAQAEYARLLAGASLVIVLGTMLHGIGVGNMLPASVSFVCVDINPAVAAKLCDRGSSHTVPVVTDVGLFVAELADRLAEPVGGPT